jgi:hypothetical protein
VSSIGLIWLIRILDGTSPGADIYVLEIHFRIFGMCMFVTVVVLFMFLTTATHSFVGLPARGVSPRRNVVPILQDISLHG